MLENTKREIKFLPAYDKRHAEDGKNYGIHGCDISFAIIGEDAAIRLMVFSQWHLLHVRNELEARSTSRFPFYHPDTAGVSYHAKVGTPKAELIGEHIVNDCDLLIDTNCVSTCWLSGLQDEWYQLLTEKGSDGLFERLEELYVEIFGK